MEIVIVKGEKDFDALTFIGTWTLRMLRACTKNMSYLNESPRGSVNTQSFITIFMYLQNENESNMFRDMTKSSKRALIIYFGVQLLTFSRKEFRDIVGFFDFYMYFIIKKIENFLIQQRAL